MKTEGILAEKGFLTNWYYKKKLFSVKKLSASYIQYTCRQKKCLNQRHIIIHTMLANTTVCISLHPTRALGYAAVTGSTKELSIGTGTYVTMITLVTEIDFADF